MNYFRQVLTVTLWEYRRFFKLKNELLGISVMLVLFSLSYFGGKYLLAESSEKPKLTVLKDSDPQLVGMLSAAYAVEKIPIRGKAEFLKQIATSKEGLLLIQHNGGFVLHAWKKPAKLKKLQKILDAYSQTMAMKKIGLTAENLGVVLSPAGIQEVYLYKTGERGRTVQAYVFAGLMLLVVFLSFAYQFTAITSEKQLKITEQIVSAIKPQAWMDGKILGITLMGMSSMLTYSIIGTLGGMLFFQYTGVSIATILQYLYLPSILLFLAFTLIGIMMWNAMLAAVASVITDPNNSGKGSLMMMPFLFVLASFMVMPDPDNNVSVFLSWFPLTSATAMPMRWVVTDVAWWQVAGSFTVLIASFYLLRRLAAKVFRVSILISGKEPTWREIIRLAGED